MVNSPSTPPYSSTTTAIWFPPSRKLSRASSSRATPGTKSGSRARDKGLGRSPESAAVSMSLA